MRVFNACLAAVATFAILATFVLMTMFANAAQLERVARSSDKVYQVFFHLKRVNTEETIERTFQAVSTPGNPLYRKFLTYPQLKELVRAPKSIADRATHYLNTEFGCSKVEALKTGDALICTLDLSQEKSLKMAKAVEAAFAEKEEQNMVRNKGIYRIDITNRVPLEIKKLLRSAQAFRALDRSLKGKSVKQLQQEKNVGFPGMTQTPVTIRQRYNIPESHSFPPLDTTVPAGVAEFEGQYFSKSSLSSFAVRYGLSDFKINILGANSPGESGETEGTLDVEYINVMNSTLPLWWLEGGMNNNQPGQIDFANFIDKVLAMSRVPAVISISWGMGDYRFDQDPSLLKTDDDSFRKAGLVGVTLLAASGDSGVGVRNEVFQCSVFSPSYPASSAYVLAVGANEAPSMEAKESAVSWSGGGFGLSSVSTTPSWQKDAVKNYLATNQNLPKSSYYDANGRGYPDVSAVGTNFNIYISGRGWELVSGTSAASPTFAGVLALIVAERVKAGKPQFGFINPTLYKLGKVGYDVVNGTNTDTNCIPGFAIQGFEAQVGWDPVSGLGSPDYQFLRANL